MVNYVNNVHFVQIVAFCAEEMAAGAAIFWALTIVMCHGLKQRAYQLHADGDCLPS